MSDPRDALEAAARQYVANLSDDQFSQLVAETREPNDPNDRPPKPKSDRGGLARGRALYAKSSWG